MINNCDHVPAPGDAVDQERWANVTAKPMTSTITGAMPTTSGLCRSKVQVMWKVKK
jgi:hypothetical protein